jgi:hypothetical protein
VHQEEKWCSNVIGAQKEMVRQGHNLQHKTKVCKHRTLLLFREFINDEEL